MTRHRVGELLRQWRHRRQLSQLDLAIAANVSPRHVSLVETGKSNPSADMILRLAEPLDVPLRDRNHLLLTAGFAPRYEERLLQGRAPSVVTDAIVRVLRAHEPYPALVLDRRWNLVMTNGAVDQFLEGAAPELRQPPINLIRLALHPRGLAPRLVNLADVRANLRLRVLRQLASSSDAELTKLYEELLATTPGAPHRLTREAELVLPMIFRLDDQRELSLFSTTTKFGSAMDVTLDELAIELYHPADDLTAAYFGR